MGYHYTYSSVSTEQRLFRTCPFSSSPTPLPPSRYVLGRHGRGREFSISETGRECWADNGSVICRGNVNGNVRFLHVFVKCHSLRGHSKDFTDQPTSRRSFITKTSPG